MERFAILFCVVILMFSALFVWGFVKTARAHREAMSYTSLYPSDFVTSKTGVSVEPLGIVTDSSHTVAAVLMRCSDMSKLSSKATDYGVLLMAQDENGIRENLISHPSGSMYVYGNTGYMVAVFYNGGADFPRQIISAGFVNLADLSTSVTSTSGEGLSDIYDLWMVAFNPGAEGVYVMDDVFGENGSFDATKFYNNVITNAEEIKIRRTLDRDLQDLDQLLAQIQEYERRCGEDGLNVSENLPEWRAGDTIELDANDMPRLVTTTVAPGGFDLDWRSGNVVDGYFDVLLRGSGETSASVLLDKAREEHKDNPLKYQSGSREWHMVSGETYAEYLTKNRSARTASFKDDIAQLERAWADYAVLKTRYQTDDLYRLLQLEIDSQSLASDWSENSEDWFVNFL